MSIQLKISHQDSISLAGIALGRRLLESIAITSDAPLENVRVEARFEPPYMEPVCWDAERVTTKGLTLPEHEEKADMAALSALANETPGLCRVTLEAAGNAPVTEEFSFTWMPAYLWPGLQEAPRELAALVLPNDPFISRIVGMAADFLGERGLSTSWQGYRHVGNLIVNQLHALWNAVEYLHLGYEACDAGRAQTVRPPTRVLEERCATTLEAALLLAALIAKTGYNPLLAFRSGRVLVGAHLKDEVLPNDLERQSSTLRDLLDRNELLLLEVGASCGEDGTPALTGFDDARESAVRLLQQQPGGDGFLALDIIHLWTGGLRPVSEVIPELRPAPSSTPLLPPEFAGASPPTEAYLPELTSEEWEEEISLISPRKRTRMENWQLKLLDLSLRNNLLNTRIDRSQVVIHVPDVAQLEDALFDGKTFSICNPPENVAPLIAGKQEKDVTPETRALLDKLSREMYAKKKLLAIPRKSTENAQQLERRIRALYLAAKHDMEESGSSTLNLACGLLKWYRPQDKETPLYAPILLIPVKLTRPSVKAGFSLQSGDEDTRINLTLLELLKTEHGITIPQLEGELPTDASGVDVPLIFRTIRQAIRNNPGWEVVDVCALGTFSFAKYLMWKDMEDRKEALLKNPIVSHLAADQPGGFPAQVDFPDPHLLDSEVDAKKVYTPLSADSSQLAAVLAAARGKNFVLIGPPGTGKSQTITNMIAHCLGHGMKVLFVAEKAAALNVVFNRLKRIGLGDFCLELHSNKANKKGVIAQFKAALEHPVPEPGGSRWTRAVNEMERLRSTLNLLPEEMHRPYPDGTSLFNDICMLALHPDAAALTPCPQDVRTCTAEEKDTMLHHAHELAMRHEPVEGILDGPAARLTATQYSFTWEDDLASALEDYVRFAREWQAKCDTLLAGLPVDKELARNNMAALLQLADAAVETCGNDVRALLPGDADETLETLRKVQQHASKFANLKFKLTLPYPDNILDDPELDLLHRQWREAQLSNFISRFFTCRRIRKTLQLKAFSRKTPDCGADLENLLCMREERDCVNQLCTPNPLPSCIQGLKTTADDIARAEKWAGMLEDIVVLRPVADVWLENRRSNPVAPGKPGALALQELRDATDRIGAATIRLAGLLGDTPPAADTPANADAIEWAEGLLKLRDHWHELTLWNEQAASSRAIGYAPMVDALVQRTVAADALESTALANFSRLRLKAAVSATQHLNRFTPHEHENRIRSFSAKDEAVLALASEQVLAALAAQAAQSADPAFRKEVNFLRHEISKQRAHKAPRTLLANIPHIAPLLKPCMLMSPLSVAQYLDAGAEPFDVVIFDEASQIPVWDAVGAIARGKSAIIVGDPRQMPPTSFFVRTKAQEDETDDAADAPVQDLESILDECRACGIPEMNLTWHYRSKSESLIAFSNHNYYEGKLTTFPAPVTEDTALQYHHTHGTYLRGAGKRINPIEAKALVDHVLQTLRAPGFTYTEATSIGIVTFNTQQQKLIEDMLEDAREQDPALEPYFSDDNPEAVFVKNLENVQGDERGSIYFSTTYGPDDRGIVSMNFGPLNLTGGERRLNVAITRARASMHVFTSLNPSDIDLNRTGARGAEDLKNFLQCAANGVGAFFSHASSGDASGGFSEAVAEALRKRGWKCSTDVGVSDFRIDVAVQHPGVPGTMLACIRTDGPGYAAACTARDRDILRESVLTGLGWRVFHLWALDWWRNPTACINALDAALRRALEEPPCQPKPLPSLIL